MKTETAPTYAIRLYLSGPIEVAIKVELGVFDSVEYVA